MDVDVPAACSDAVPGLLRVLAGRAYAKGTVEKIAIRPLLPSEPRLKSSLLNTGQFQLST